MTLLDLYEDLYTCLSNYTELTELLAAEGIYDFEPDEETPGPYIVIGDTHEVRGRVMADEERTVYVRLHVWSSYHGRKEIIEIERKIEEALEGDLYLFESFQVIRDESDWMHGVVVFRTYLERNDA